MVNLGRPSPGCYLCRKRKVKCDLTQPECLRCQKFGEPCPGYRSISNFRNETVASIEASRVLSRSSSPEPSSKKKSSPTEVTAWKLYQDAGIAQPQPERKSDSAIEDEAADFERSYKLPSGFLTEPMETQVIPVILDYMSNRPQAANAADLGIMSFFPTLLREAGARSALALTCQALASAYFQSTARNSGFEPTESAADSAHIYGQALAAINQSLRSPEQCTSDATLLCIWLMGLREQIARDMSDVESGGPTYWRIHVQGLISLLRTRGVIQFVTETGRQLFWLVMHSVTIRAILVGESCPKETLDWLKALESYGDGMSRYGYKVTEYGYWASVLCSKVRKVMKGGWTGSTLSSAVREVFEDLDQLESDAVVSLSESNRRFWQSRQTSPGSPKRSPSGSPQQNQDTVQISFCNKYFALRIRVHQTILLLLRHLHSSEECPIDSRKLDERHRASVSAVTAISKEILAYLCFVSDYEECERKMAEHKIEDFFSSSSRKISGWVYCNGT